MRYRGREGAAAAGRRKRCARRRRRWQRWSDGCAERLEVRCCYFSSTSVVRARVRGRKGGSSGAAVRALFERMLYLAIQSSYGRSDSGFEHSWCGHARRRRGGGQ